MNVETGKVYTDHESIRKAFDRGERLVPISPKAAKLLGIGRARRVRELRRRRKLNRRAMATT